MAHFDDDGNAKDFLKNDDGQITLKEKLGEEEFNKNSKIMFDLRKSLWEKFTL